MAASLLGTPVSLYAQAVPVEKLVEQGVTKVPEAYRRALDLQQDQAADDHSQQIPVIDLSDLTTSRSEIQRACREWGFFRIINHGVPEAVMDDLLNSSTAFFSLPFEEKMRYHVPGFEHRQTSYHTRFDNQSIADWRDYLQLSRYPSSVDSWPEMLKDAAQVYCREVHDLGLKLLSLVSESLGLPPKRLEEALQETQVRVNINRYLPCPEPKLVLGVRNHSDPGILAILLENKVPGLQVLHEGSWVTLAPVQGSLVVNIGDHLEILSNGRYKSAPSHVRSVTRLVQSRAYGLQGMNRSSLPAGGMGKSSDSAPPAPARDRSLLARLGQRFNPAGIVLTANVILRDRQMLLPHLEVPNISWIDWKALKGKGFQGVVFDKDNTLTAPYVDWLWPPLADSLKECKEQFGMDNLAILSNSAGLHQFDPLGIEAQNVTRSLGIFVIRHGSKKPSGNAEALKSHFGCDPYRLVMVGDRYLTDVVYGNKNGLLTIVTEPLTPAGEPFIVKKVRKIESVLVRWWKSMGYKPPDHQLYSAPSD